MDLNCLFSRHQLSLMRAADAPSDEARRVHHGSADGYAQRIRAFQSDAGATSVLWSATSA